MTGTYVFPHNGTEARDPYDAAAAHLSDEEAFARQEALCQPLALVILYDSLRCSQECVFAHIPRLLTAQSQICDITKAEWGQQQLTRPNVRTNHHITADKPLLYPKADLAFERDGRRHGEHDAWLGADGTAHGQLDGEYCVGVAVADAVAASIESAHVVLSRADTHEVRVRGRSARHLSRRV